MSGFFRRLFGGHATGGVIDDERVTVEKSQPRKYKLEGKVLKVWDGPDEILASGGCIKEAESADALKEAWERDMKRAFPIGPDYNVEYHCTVTPVDDEPERDDSDDGDIAAAAVAAVAATTMFR